MKSQEFHVVEGTRPVTLLPALESAPHRLRAQPILSKVDATELIEESLWLVFESLLELLRRRHTRFLQREIPRLVFVTIRYVLVREGYVPESSIKFKKQVEQAK